MQTVTRRLQFCSGHRVFKHESSCANLHGHNYVIHITAKAPKLDAVGRDIDFKELKTKFGDWIDQTWDHGFLWFKDDPVCKVIFQELEISGGMKNFECDFNPTAENMAEHVLRVVAPKLLKGTKIKVTEVRLEETENCSAVAMW